MGTGIVSILLFNLPYNVRWVYWLSVVIYCLNMVLFITFTVISILRYTMFEGIWSAMLRHPVQSMFLVTEYSLPTQRSITDPQIGHFSNGTGNYRQYDSLRLRTTLGPPICDSDLDPMVD